MGQYTAHGYLYKPSYGETGRDTTSQFNAGLDLVDAYMAGEAFSAPDFGTSTLAEIVTAIGSDPATIYFPSSTVNIDENTTVTSNIVCIIPKGGILHVADDVTLTINGYIDAGPYQIFSWDGTGSVVISRGQEIYAEWWGALGDGTTEDTAAFDAAMIALPSGGTIRLLKKTYAVDTLLNWSVGMRIIGQSKYYSQIKSFSGNTILEIDNLDIHSFEIGYLSLVGNGGSGHGFYTHGAVNNSYLFSLHDLWITGCGGRGIFDENGFSQEYRNIFVTLCDDNLIEVAGGPGTVLQNIYAGEVASGKCGFRIYNSPTLIGCNGINSGDYWGIFGRTVALDGVLSYAQPLLIGCNIEAFAVTGIDCRAGSTLFIKPYTTFIGPAAGTVKAINVPDAPNKIATWEGVTFQTLGASWANSRPVHSRYGLAAVVFDVEAGTTIKYAYDDTAGADVLMPRWATAYVALNTTGISLNAAAIGDFSAGTYAGFDSSGVFSHVGANAQKTTISKNTTEIVSFDTAATHTWTNGIPAGTMVVGVTSRVTEDIVGPTTIDIGDGSTVDAFANGTGVTSGTQTNLASGTATTPKIYPAATNIVITANGAGFTGGTGKGKLRLTVHYISLTAPSS